MVLGRDQHGVKTHDHHCIRSISSWIDSILDGDHQPHEASLVSWERLRCAGGGRPRRRWLTSLPGIGARLVNGTIDSGYYRNIPESAWAMVDGINSILDDEEAGRRMCTGGRSIDERSTTLLFVSYVIRLYVDYCSRCQCDDNSTLYSFEYVCRYIDLILLFRIIFSSSAIISRSTWFM